MLSLSDGKGSIQRQVQLPQSRRDSFSLPPRCGLGSYGGHSNSSQASLKLSVFRQSQFEVFSFQCSV